MYGVTRALGSLLEHFVGHALDEIRFDHYQLQLHFVGRGSIAIDGGWQLCDETGAVIDAVAVPRASRDAYRVHKAIERLVVRVELDEPRSFTLVFDSGHRFTVFDDEGHHESFAVHVEGLPSAYV